MKKFLLFILFSWVFISNSQVFTYAAGPASMAGAPGSAFNYNITFSNPTGSPITISFERYQKYNPPYWYSCFCYFQCNPPSMDTIQINLAANSSSLMTVLFKTDSVNPGIATASIRFYQLGFPNNSDTICLNASTMPPTVLKTNSIEGVLNYPNPTNGEFIFTPSEFSAYELLLSDISGKIIYHQKDLTDKKNILHLEDQPAGQYFLRVVYKTGKTENKKIIKN